jgi:hypothetical protein
MSRLTVPNLLSLRVNRRSRPDPGETEIRPLPQPYYGQAVAALLRPTAPNLRPRHHRARARRPRRRHLRRPVRAPGAERHQGHRRGRPRHGDRRLVLGYIETAFWTLIIILVIAAAGANEGYAGLGEGPLRRGSGGPRPIRRAARPGRRRRGGRWRGGRGRCRPRRSAPDLAVEPLGGVVGPDLAPDLWGSDRVAPSSFEHVSLSSRLCG